MKMRRTLAWTTLAALVAAAAPAVAQTYTPGTAYTPSVIDSKGVQTTGRNGSIADVWKSRSDAAAKADTAAPGAGNAAGTTAGATTAPSGAVGTSGSSM